MTTDEQETDVPKGTVLLVWKRGSLEQARCRCAGCARLRRTFPDGGAMTTDEQETDVPKGSVLLVWKRGSLEQAR